MMNELITDEMLEWQRYEFAGSYERLKEIRSEPNYYAPSSWTMYTWEDGDQHRLWDRRYDDGAIWSALKSRDIAKSTWWKTVVDNSTEY